MSTLREALIRRRSRHVSRSNSTSDPTTDEDSENSRCPSPLLAIHPGYRVDPFMRFPVSRASRGVRFMADYCGFNAAKVAVTPAHACICARYPDMGTSTGPGVQSAYRTQCAFDADRPSRVPELDAVRGHHRHVESSVGPAARIGATRRQDAAQTSRRRDEGAAG
jgi:hypothetical protein